MDCKFLRCVCFCVVFFGLWNVWIFDLVYKCCGIWFCIYVWIIDLVVVENCILVYFDLILEIDFIYVFCVDLSF